MFEKANKKTDNKASINVNSIISEEEEKKYQKNAQEREEKLKEIDQEQKNKEAKREQQQANKQTKEQPNNQK